MAIKQYRSQLAESANAAITHGYWAKPTGASRLADKETEYVATLIESCVGPLTAAWGGILKHENLDITIQGAFLHQRPYVRFPSPTTADCGSGHCELADLLLVFDHEESSRRACLIQVKRNPGGSVNGDQKELYEKWEPFRFRHGQTKAKGRPYKIDPNTEGCRYGIVQIPRRNIGDPWSTEHPRGRTSAIAMGEMMAGMIIAAVDGYAAPGRSADIDGDDDWSVLINDLLSMSKKATYPLRGFWTQHRQRGFCTVLGVEFLQYYIFSTWPWSLPTTSSWIITSTTGNMTIDQLQYFQGSIPPGGERGDRDTDAGDPEGLSVIYVKTSESKS